VTTKSKQKDLKKYKNNKQTKKTNKQANKQKTAQ
jgi:hypothetical protein